MLPRGLGLSLGNLVFPKLRDGWLIEVVHCGLSLGDDLGFLKHGRLILVLHCCLPMAVELETVKELVKSSVD